MTAEKNKVTVKKAKKHPAQTKRKKHPGAFGKFFSHWGSSIFYIGVIIFIFAAILLINSFQTTVRAFLCEYESSRSVYTVQNIFREYFSTPDFNLLLEESGYELSPFNTKQELVEHFNKRVEGRDISFVYVAGSDKTRVNVKADGDKFASFSIKKSEQTTQYGFEIYTLDEIKTFFVSEKSVQVTVPSAYFAEVNGIMLGEEYKTVTGETDDDRDVIPEGTYKFTYDTYTVDGLLNDPQVRIIDAQGREVSAEYDDEQKQYSVGYVYDDALRAEYSEYVITATEQYAARIQNAITFSEVSGYFERGTVLYTNIRENPASFVWEYNSYEFSDRTADSFFAYDADTFSCRVRLTQILHKNNRPDNIDRIDLNLYLRRGEDGTFRIYDMETN